MTKVIYLCNALDEETKNSRFITTDSPAATKKVFSLCYALKTASVASIILSMGRGRQNGTSMRFPKLRKSINGIDVLYASFWHIPVLTHVVTALSLMLNMRILIKKGGNVLLVYNCCWHYIPALLLAKLFGLRCFLDLEDGWVDGKQSWVQKTKASFFNWACNSGSLLACDALKSQVKTDRNLTCYGAVSTLREIKRDWNSDKIQVLFGGSLSEGTGAKLFIEAIEVFMRKYPSTRHSLHVTVVGFGDMTQEIARFATCKTGGMVEFRGSVSNSDYAELLDSNHIGLCLKLSSGPFHDSTFPSKVIELSSNGLLIISTPVSDVPKLFSSEMAILLPSDSAEALADALFWVVKHRQEASFRANRGRDMIVQRFSEEAVGLELRTFLYNENRK